MPCKFEEGDASRSPSFDALGEHKAEPAEPADVEGVASVNEVRDEGPCPLYRVDPSVPLAEELSPMVLDVVREDEPHDAEALHCRRVVNATHSQDHAIFGAKRVDATARTKLKRKSQDGRQRQ